MNLFALPVGTEKLRTSSYYEPAATVAPGTNYGTCYIESTYNFFVLLVLQSLRTLQWLLLTSYWYQVLYQLRRGFESEFTSTW